MKPTTVNYRNSDDNVTVHDSVITNYSYFNPSCPKPERDILVLAQRWKPDTQQKGVTYCEKKT